jgi:acetyl-CoA acetyltransferase
VTTTDINPIRNQVAIAAAAFSKIARRSDEPIGKLAVKSCLEAIAEAGLQPSDIDGLSNYPHPSRHGAGAVDGVDLVSVEYLAQALELRNLRWSCSLTRGTVTAALVEAVNAVAAGACRYALVWRAMHNPAGSYGRVRYDEVPGAAQFTLPYGFGHNVINYALVYSRYLAKYGGTREQMATFIVRNRLNAAANPEAVFYDQPITRSDYLHDRMVAEPLSVLDCDMGVDGCGALVVTTAERARNLQLPPAYVTGCCSLGLPPRKSLVPTLEDFQESSRSVAQNLWRNAGIRSDDVTHLHLYDGFSFFPALWLEAFEFCKEGEGLEFLQGNETDRTGSLPLNTSGGALGMGRLHGTPQLIEAVMQIQSRCGPRQIEDPSVAIVQVGFPQQGTATVALSKEPS